MLYTKIETVFISLLYRLVKERMNPPMSYIAKQSYNKIIQEISRIEIKKYTETMYLYLYQDKLTTMYREFLISEIMYLSFKQMQGKGGILFLHTNHGVYSYHVINSPAAFIETCKHLIGK